MSSRKRGWRQRRGPQTVTLRASPRQRSAQFWDPSLERAFALLQLTMEVLPHLKVAFGVEFGAEKAEGLVFFHVFSGISSRFWRF